MMSDQEFSNYLESIGGLKFNKTIIKDRRFFNIKNGWLSLTKEIIDELINQGWNKEIFQVKQKFGGLRFYIGKASPEIYNLIHKYEYKSYNICEVCGKNGSQHKSLSGWIDTLCDEHKNLKI